MVKQISQRNYWFVILPWSDHLVLLNWLFMGIPITYECWNGTPKLSNLDQFWNELEQQQIWNSILIYDQLSSNPDVQTFNYKFTSFVFSQCTQLHLKANPKILLSNTSHANQWLLDITQKQYPLQTTTIDESTMRTNQDHAECLCQAAQDEARGSWRHDSPKYQWSGPQPHIFEHLRLNELKIQTLQLDESLAAGVLDSFISAKFNLGTSSGPSWYNFANRKPYIFLCCLGENSAQWKTTPIIIYSLLHSHKFYMAWY